MERRSFFAAALTTLAGLSTVKAKTDACLRDCTCGLKQVAFYSVGWFSAKLKIIDVGVQHWPVEGVDAAPYDTAGILWFPLWCSALQTEGLSCGHQGVFKADFAMESASMSTDLMLKSMTMQPTKLNCFK